MWISVMNRDLKENHDLENLPPRQVKRLWQVDVVIGWFRVYGLGPKPTPKPKP